ncbi:MAG: hypothetical protein Kow0089_02110 [Desulfobulbaceae bacterium]
MSGRNDGRVLVVGTTSDYIDWIRRERPGKAVFLTDYGARTGAVEESPQPAEEIVTDLEDFEQTEKDLHRHMNRWGYRPVGVVCFDCESLELAAFLAQLHGLDFPTLESIRICRDKFAMKDAWRKSGVGCPRARIVTCEEELYGFMREIDGPCVIKPRTGSGSELVFFCDSRKDCGKWARIMLGELGRRTGNRLYSRSTAGFVAEEYIRGKEYSCDFIAGEEEVQILRLTRKISADGRPFGTIAGYVLMDLPTGDFPVGLLEENLHRAAVALGLRGLICMVDFLVSDGEIVLLEMSPRPGGDCIPQLLRRAGRPDILALAVDLAGKGELVLPSAGKGELVLPSYPRNGRLVALRLHARKKGRITGFRLEKMRADPRVREIQLVRSEGHVVVMPPEDYDSWYLGYVIFQPGWEEAVEEECRELSGRFRMEIGS